MEISRSPHAQPDQSVIEYVRVRFERRWVTLRSRMLSTFDRLSAEDLDTVNGNYDQFAERLVSAYGCDRGHINHEILRFVFVAEGSVPYAAVTEEEVV